MEHVPAATKLTLLPAPMVQTLPVVVRTVKLVPAERTMLSINPSTRHLCTYRWQSRWPCGTSPRSPPRGGCWRRTRSERTACLLRTAPAAPAGPSGPARSGSSAAQSPAPPSRARPDRPGPGEKERPLTDHTGLTIISRASLGASSASTAARELPKDMSDLAEGSAKEGEGKRDGEEKKKGKKGEKRKHFRQQNAPEEPNHVCKRKRIPRQSLFASIKGCYGKSRQ